MLKIVAIVIGVAWCIMMISSLYWSIKLEILIRRDKRKLEELRNEQGITR